MKLAIQFGLLILIVSGVFTVTAVGLLVHDEQPALHQALVSVQNIEAAAIPVSGQIAGLADDLDTIVENEGRAEAEQIKQVKLVSTAAINAFNETNHSLNEILVPRLAASLDGLTTLEASTTTDLANTSKNLNASIMDLQPILKDMARGASNAADVMGDPALRETLTGVRDSAYSLAAATASGAHAMDTTDKFITKEAEQILAPPRKAAIVIYFVLKGAGKFFGF